MVSYSSQLGKGGGGVGGSGTLEVSENADALASPKTPNSPK